MKLSEGVALKLREELAVELREEVDRKAEPIRLDTEPDIVETEIQLGKQSPIHNLAFCVIN